MSAAVESELIQPAQVSLHSTEITAANAIYTHHGLDASQVIIMSLAEV